MNVNLGCGKDYRKGWFNVDINSAFADKNLDINLEPLSMKTPYILANNVLEHLEVSGIENIFKTLDKDGILEGIVPHYLSRHSCNDFSHNHYFNEEIFKHYPFTLFHIEKIETWYCFGKLIRFKLPQWIVTLHERLLPGFMPPSHISFKLRRI